MDNKLKNRLENERKHALYLLDNNAEAVWGWSTPAGKFRAKRRADYFINYGLLRQGVTVLEIGCGTGMFTKELGKSEAQVTAIDISPELLAHAKNTIKSPNVVFEEQDAMHMSFEDNSFDVVLGCSVLHHLEASVALKEFNRVLKPGGKIMFSEPNMLNPQIALQKNIPYLKRLAGDSPDETAFFPWQAKGLMKETGFKDCKVMPFDFLHPATPAKLIKPISFLGRVLEAVPLVRSIAGSIFIFAKK